jgi:hypothetical protein
LAVNATLEPGAPTTFGAGLIDAFTAASSLLDGTAPGQLNITATLDGAPWPASGIANINYNITGLEGVINEHHVPATADNVTPGPYTLAYHSGAPPNSTFTGVTPAKTQLLKSGQSGAFTLNFATVVETTQAILNGQPWSGSLTYTLTGPNGVINGQSVPQNKGNLQPGVYSVNYVNGGPSGGIFIGASPSVTQTLTAPGTITFTLEFITTSSPQTITYNYTGTVSLVLAQGFTDPGVFKVGDAVSGTLSYLYPPPSPGIVTGPSTAYDNMVVALSFVADGIQLVSGTPIQYDYSDITPSSAQGFSPQIQFVYGPTPGGPNSLPFTLCNGGLFSLDFLNPSSTLDASFPADLDPQRFSIQEGSIMYSNHTITCVPGWDAVYEVTFIINSFTLQ